MMRDCQSPALARSLEALQPGRRTDIASTIVFALVPGVARRQVTFFASPKKVTKERRPEVRRPSGSLRCSRVKAAAELGLVVATRKRFYAALALKQSSPTTPSLAVLVGSSHRDPCVSRRLLLYSVIPAQAGIQVE